MLSAGRIPGEPLLSSYEAERRDVARKTMAMTHLLFWAEAGTGMIPSFLRGTMGPLAAPFIPVILRRRRLIAEGIRVLSQLRWNYRDSPLSRGMELPVSLRRTGPCGRPGERLPDAAVVVNNHRRQLHELTAVAGFHVLLERGADRLRPSDLVHVHRIDSWPGRDSIVVRPDGHVGYRGPTRTAEIWLGRLGLAAIPETRAT